MDQPKQFDDPTLKTVYNLLYEAKGNLVSSRDLKDAAGPRWRDAVTTLTDRYGLKISVTLGGSGNQSFRLEIQDVPKAPASGYTTLFDSAELPRVVNVEGRDVATQMHPGIDPLVRGPQLLTEPFPLPYPDPAPPTVRPVVTTVVGAMLPDMVLAWQKLHGERPTGVTLPFALKTSLKDLTVDIRKLGLRVFFADVPDVTFVVEGTALLTEDSGSVPRHRPDALY